MSFHRQFRSLGFGSAPPPRPRRPTAPRRHVLNRRLAADEEPDFPRYHAPEELGEWNMPTARAQPPGKAAYSSFDDADVGTQWQPVSMRMPGASRMGG